MEGCLRVLHLPTIVDAVYCDLLVRKAGCPGYLVREVADSRPQWLSCIAVLERTISNYSSNTLGESFLQFLRFLPNNVIVLARIEVDLIQYVFATSECSIQRSSFRQVENRLVVNIQQSPHFQQPSLRNLPAPPRFESQRQNLPSQFVVPTCFVCGILYIRK